MSPNLYELAMESSEVVGLLSVNGDLRFYEDEAPQETALPYVRWQVISGLPFNKLDEVPDGDDCRVQFDLYAADQDSRKAIYEALRDAFELHGYIVGYQTGRDPETRSYAAQFDMTFKTNR